MRNDASQGCDLLALVGINVPLLEGLEENVLLIAQRSKEDVDNRGGFVDVRRFLKSAGRFGQLKIAVINRTPDIDAGRDAERQQHDNKFGSKRQLDTPAPPFEQSV